MITGISDEDLIIQYSSGSRASKKSLYESINKLIDARLVSLDWNRQSPIFNTSEFRSSGKQSRWTLDFAKESLAVEVAFNHGEAVAWNLI